MSSEIHVRSWRIVGHEHDFYDFTVQLKILALKSLWFKNWQNKGTFKITLLTDLQNRPFSTTTFNGIRYRERRHLNPFYIITVRDNFCNEFLYKPKKAGLPPFCERKLSLTTYKSYNSSWIVIHRYFRLECQTNWLFFGIRDCK